MIWEPVYLIVLGIVFLSTLTQSTFGFGNALVAMTMLELFLPVSLVNPLVALVSFTVSFLIVLSDWRDIQLQGTSFFIVSSLIGVPVGIFWIYHAPEGLIKGILGVLIMAFSLFCLNKPRQQWLTNDKLSGVFGVGSGRLGGAYNTYGHLLVMYGTLRGWSRDHFRATLQGCFLPTSVLILVIHACSGWWTTQVVSLFLYSFPFAVAGMLLGSYLAKRLKKDHFVRYVYLLLFCLGASLVVRVCTILLNENNTHSS